VSLVALHAEYALLTRLMQLGGATHLCYVRIPDDKRWALVNLIGECQGCLVSSITCILIYLYDDHDGHCEAEVRV